MAESRPNIILINTDQQRYDTIGSLGFPWMKTPNLDRLVAEGVSFTNCFCTAPSCVPSRASFYNLKYPHDLGVYDNGFPWSTSWVYALRDSGYRTINVGKMHTVPYDYPCGFERRFFVENKDRPAGPTYTFDEWDKFLLASGQRKPSRKTYKAEYPGYETALGAYEWPLEEKYHPDVFTGNLAQWYINEHQGDEPLFLEIGFPGPHPPFDPPERYIRMYDDVDIPVPDVTDGELAGQPPPHAGYRAEMIRGNHDAVKWIEKPTREQLLRLRRYYAANMTLIDDQIGMIMDALKERGFLENAIVVFMSDHGDALGDHGHIQKWTMYDCITRMPMVLWAPGRLPAGKSVDGLLQQFDIAQTLLDYAGVPIPEDSRSQSVLPLVEGESEGREAVFAEHSLTVHLKELKFMTMVRTKDWKLVHYLDQDFGELYDLNADPEESKNLWSDPRHEETKRKLLDVLREWRIRLPERQMARMHQKAVTWSADGRGGLADKAR